MTGTDETPERALFPESWEKASPSLARLMNDYIEVARSEGVDSVFFDFQPFYSLNSKERSRFRDFVVAVDRQVSYESVVPPTELPQGCVLEMRLTADGRVGLYRKIREHEPLILSEGLGGLRLVDYGSECLLFAGRLGDELAAAKIAMAEYEDSYNLQIEKLIARRTRLEKEAELLTVLVGSPLPRFRSLLTVENPLLSRCFPSSVRDCEVLLVMEFIHGKRADRHARELSRSSISNETQLFSLDLASAFLALQVVIQNCLGLTHFYTDIKPENAIVESDGQIRIVDGGSIMESQELEAGIRISPLYLSAIDYRRYMRGDHGFDLAWMQRSLSRVMKIVAFDPPARVGEDLGIPSSAPSHFLNLLSCLAEGQFSTVHEANSAIREVRGEIVSAPPLSPG